jgi:DNA recombination protein RmuC
MSASLYIIAAFVIALFIGIYIGKTLLAANSKLYKASLEEKLKALLQILGFPSSELPTSLMCRLF